MIIPKEFYMDLFIAIFGSGKDINLWQMSLRAIIVFLFTLILIRFSGRRSFGLRAPMDNIILVLLGAILSRAVVGASPFIPTLSAGLVIVLLHRLCAYGSLWHWIGKWTKGEKVLLFKEGNFIPKNLRRCLVSEEDIIEEVRIRALINSFEEIQEIYMERNGCISPILKKRK